MAADKSDYLDQEQDPFRQKIIDELRFIAKGLEAAR